MGEEQRCRSIPAWYSCYTITKSKGDKIRINRGFDREAVTHR
jgi:hypothetical protein